MEDIDHLLDNYDPGKPDYKPDVKKQLAELRIDRENKMQEQVKKQAEYKDTLNKISMIMNPKAAQQQINDQSILIQELTSENNQLKEQVDYLNGRIRLLIASQVKIRKEEKTAGPM